MEYSCVFWDNGDEAKFRIVTAKKEEKKLEKTRSSKRDACSD